MEILGCCRYFYPRRFIRNVSVSENNDDVEFPSAIECFWFARGSSFFLITSKIWFYVNAGTNKLFLLFLFQINSNLHDLNFYLIQILNTSLVFYLIEF